MVKLYLETGKVAFIGHPGVTTSLRCLNDVVMYAPATAAIFFAALTTLPCKGTDADTSTVPDKPEVFQPSVNMFYQMLHGSINETKPDSMPSFAYINPIDKFVCCRDVPEDANETDRFNGAIPSVKKHRKRRVDIIRQNENATYARRVELTTMVSFERRRKPGETGSSAPLLNYIFDTYTNTHQHRNERPGNGNSIYVAAAPEIEALVGSTAYMDCKVDALHDKLVSWVRRKSDETPMELLTTGTQLYTADNRYSARFIPPDIWRLEVKSVRPTDAAFYDCQLSAHPPRTARVTLRVPEVSVRIVDGAGALVSEQVCEVGSTVALRCEVRGLKMEGGPSLLWHRREFLLNDDTTRGGISVRTEFGANGANSVLRVARVRGADAGRYSCSVARAPPPAPPPAHVMLHVIKGESLAELHQGVNSTKVNYTIVIILTLCVILQAIYII
ncbi:unnamed protein product [Leptosia nina]|uniref:Ig-like domain-containing protein n=1 Tax=Leptosia nina TaxID=320188 RepID=A0AAV1J711_9NEOP